MTPMKPVIFGCAGPALTPEERTFFAAERPCGFILFRRNCVDVAQTQALVESMREIIDDPLAPIFIDQEGGRVLRMRPPVWWKAPASGAIGKLADRDLDAAVALARDTGAAIGAQLGECGVNVDFAPCLDILFPYTHDAIGDRAFHSDPAIVITLGRAFMDGLALYGVQACLKHLPGHGRARLDSHLDLPVIEASVEELERDLAPFIALNDQPWGIVSHLLFPALDPSAPATLSPKIIAEVIRGRIGFEGLIVTDDISMKALREPVEASSARAIEAGCDIVCHCNGEMAEMAAIADALAPMNESLTRRFETIRRPCVSEPFAEVAALAADIDARVAALA
jgi:beta-N-acetylhexosaminidase